MDGAGIWRIRDTIDANPLRDGEELKLTFVHHGPHSSTCVVQLREQTGVRPHIHRTHDEILHIVEGEGEFRIGDRSEHVRRGDVVTVPAGTVHSPTHTRTGLVIVSVFAPQFDPSHPDRVFVQD